MLSRRTTRRSGHMLVITAVTASLLMMLVFAMIQQGF
jgi:hypothetical protein